MSRLKCGLLGLVVVMLSVLSVDARQGDSQQAPAISTMADYEGAYEYYGNSRLFLVTIADRLFAVLGDGKYPLRQTGADTFVNGSGDEIPFVRNTSGQVEAFRERGVTYRRLSSSVPASVRGLLEARPRRADGQTDGYTYAAPPRLSDGIAISFAASATLPASVSEQLVNGVIDGTYQDVRAIVLYHKGALQLEEYFYGYTRERPHPMRSLTKTVITMLAGVAVDRGILPADQPVLARLGYQEYANADARKARITLTDLLSNQSGFACDDHDGSSPGNEVKIYEAADWVKAFVDLPMAADPGTTGRYCSAGFITVGRLIERATGVSLPTFARQVLFEPLGISQADWTWTFAPERSQRDEFGQIYLRPRVMLKLGLLLQQLGEWNGARILSTSWVDAMLSRQSHVDDSDYGLGVWHRWYQVDTPSGPRRIDTVMLSGNGGQKVYLVPSVDLIAVFTGGAFNTESPVNAMMSQVLLPALLR